MSRLGYLCAGEHFDEGVENLIESCRLPGLIHEGIYTHFAVSDQEDEESREYTRQQFKLFMDVLAAVKERGGISFPLRHCANSGAVVNYPETALDMVPACCSTAMGTEGNWACAPACAWSPP